MGPQAGQPQHVQHPATRGHGSCLLIWAACGACLGVPGASCRPRKPLSTLRCRTSQEAGQIYDQSLVHGSQPLACMLCWQASWTRCSCGAPVQCERPRRTGAFAGADSGCSHAGAVPHAAGWRLIDLAGRLGVHLGAVRPDCSRQWPGVLGAQHHGAVCTEQPAVCGCCLSDTQQS